METPAKTYGRARRLRRRMTPPEVRPWVRFRRVPDLDIRRQHPWRVYILDFFCADARLCIEVDGVGAQDWTRADPDARRTGRLNAAGLDVVRVMAADVMRDPDGVAEDLIADMRARAAARARR